MSIRTDFDLISDIKNSIERIKSYCENLNYSEFKIDFKTQDAVIRNLEIIGEAAGRISAIFKMNNPDIPRDIIKGTRNRLIHDYSGVNLDILWNIIKDDLTNLYLKISKKL